MAYRWTVPEDIEEDSVFRLKLTIDNPPATHLSGRFRLSRSDAEPSPSMETEAPEIAAPSIVNVTGDTSSPMRMEAPESVGLSTVNVAGVALLVTLSLLLTCWVSLRLRRRSKQIVLG